MARSALRTAAAAGLIHAGFSLYWALGGRWLLPTVGQWAVQLADDRPVAAGLALGVVALVKAAAATLPLLWMSGRLRPRRVWGWLFGLGAGVLICYGALNTAVSWAVLSGALHSPGGFDRTAQLGHAGLWDPLFLVWGLLLAVGLRDVHRQRFASASPGH